MYCNQCALVCIVALNVMEGRSQKQAAMHRYCFQSLGCRSPVGDSTEFQWTSNSQQVDGWRGEHDQKLGGPQSCDQLCPPQKTFESSLINAGHGRVHNPLALRHQGVWLLPLWYACLLKQVENWVQSADFMQTLSQQSPAHRTLSTLLCPKIYLHLLTNLDNIHCVQERANREREIDKQTGRESFDTYDTYKVVPPSAISWFINPSNTNRYIYSYLSVIYIYMYKYQRRVRVPPNCASLWKNFRPSPVWCSLHPSPLPCLSRNAQQQRGKSYIHFIRICYARSMVINQLYHML